MDEQMEENNVEVFEVIFKYNIYYKNFLGVEDRRLRFDKSVF